MVCLEKDSNPKAIDYLIIEEESGYVHLGGKPYLCLDADQHQKRPILFFTKNDKYKHQRFMIDESQGTLVLKSDKTWVVGLSDNLFDLTMVKKHSDKKLVFADIHIVPVEPDEEEEAK